MYIVIKPLFIASIYERIGSLLVSFGSYSRVLGLYGTQLLEMGVKDGLSVHLGIWSHLRYIGTKIPQLIEKSKGHCCRIPYLCSEPEEKIEYGC